MLIMKTSNMVFLMEMYGIDCDAGLVPHGVTLNEFIAANHELVACETISETYKTTYEKSKLKVILNLNWMKMIPASLDHHPVWKKLLKWSKDCNIFFNAHFMKIWLRLYFKIWVR